LPLLERARVEVYVPDLPAPHYHNLLLSFEEEFTYAFGGLYYRAAARSRNSPRGSPRRRISPAQLFHNRSILR
jgi:hypothetical protein